MLDILLADDQPQVRSALRLLLEQEAQARVVGEAENARDLVERTREVHPTAILVDWELPGLSMSEGLSAVRRVYPSARIIALSSRPEVRQTALEAGADGFVCKGDPPEQLLAVLNTWRL
jgi:DNA-binding NarL/FixJ family response regulator